MCLKAGSTQSEKAQDRQNDHNQANNVDDIVHRRSLKPVMLITLHNVELRNKFELPILRGDSPGASFGA